MSKTHSRLAALRAKFDGIVVLPGDVQYDAAREIWNRLHDQRPAVIVRCVTSDHVVAALRFARENDLEVAIKSGGHHAAGYAACEGGMLLDLSGMRRIAVDPVGPFTRSEPGLTWAHFDQVTQAFGLACTGPIVSMTGLAGFTLGGGFGWLHRKIGLACDNLVSARVVTAECEIRTASASDDADLLWGLQGSGWNFGVVTEMELRLHSIGPTVVAGLIYFPLEQLPALVEQYRALMPQFPDDLTTWFFLRLAPPVPVIPKVWVGRPVAALAMCHCGAVETGLEWGRRLAAVDDLIVSTVAAVEYRNWQRALDTRWGNGFFNDWRGHYIDDLGPDIVRVLMNHVDRLESPWTDIKIPHLEGAVGRIGESATSYGSRSAKFGLVIQARWEKPSETEHQRAWAKELRDALAPHTTGRVYTNFLARDETDRIPAAHGPENYQRLRRLKAKYDPTNFFRVNPNIIPAN